MSNPSHSLSRQSKVPEFIRIDLRKDGPKLAILLVSVGAAAFMWYRSVQPAAGVPGDGQALSASAQAEVAREYQVPPLPQPPQPTAGKEPLIKWVPISRSDPFSALIKPSDGNPGESNGSAVASGPVEWPLTGSTVPVRPIVPVTKPLPRVIVKRQVLPSSSISPSEIKVLGIGEGGGVFTALIQVGTEGSIVGVGDTIGKGLKVKEITSEKVILQQGKSTIQRFLEEDGGATNAVNQAAGSK